MCKIMCKKNVFLHSYFQSILHRTFKFETRILEIKVEGSMSQNVDIEIHKGIKSYPLFYIRIRTKA